MLFHSFQILKCGQCQYPYSLVMLLNLVINHNINAKLLYAFVVDPKNCWLVKMFHDSSQDQIEHGDLLCSIFITTYFGLYYLHENWFA